MKLGTYVGQKLDYSVFDVGLTGTINDCIINKFVEVGQKFLVSGKLTETETCLTRLTFPSVRRPEKALKYHNKTSLAFNISSNDYMEKKLNWVVYNN